MTSLPDSLQLLGPDSYTSSRLEHATPTHINLTSRRCFIGPIPEGWLQSHHKHWYKHHLRIHYSSRRATFTAPPSVGRHRRLTDIDGPSATATYGSSFPQPRGLGDEGEHRAETNYNEEDEDDEQQELRLVQAINTHDERGVPNGPATTDLPPALNIPRAQEIATADDPSSKNEDRTGKEEATRAGSSAGTIRPTSPDVARQEQHQDTSSTASSHAQRDASHQIQEITTGSKAVTASENTATPPKPTASRDDANASQHHSESSDSATPIWLSPLTSRQISRDFPVVDHKQSRSGSQASFVTANEDIAATPKALEPVAEDDAENVESPPKLPDQLPRTPSSPLPPKDVSQTHSRQSSQASLIHHDQHDGTAANNAAEGIQHPAQEGDLESEHSTASPDQLPSAPVRFDIPEDDQERRRMMKVRLAQMRKRDTFKRIRRGTIHDGEIVKVANMLVRLESTVHKVTDDYAEEESQKIETTAVERWKEFMCVCRENDEDDRPFVLQLYKSRVIPALEKTSVKKRWAHEIQLRPSNCKVNLYSSLDKTIVIWHPSRRGTLIYTMQSRSGADSMEWYTFLRNVLGWSRTGILSVNVPDLAVNLRIDRPFEALESSRAVAQAAAGNEQAMLRTMKEEQAVTSRIVGRCIEMLEKSSDWEDVLKEWKGTSRMGLAWRRYDRLEWVHGANERKMYGTIGMDRTHELELRPKQHYPTSVHDVKRHSLVEPAGIEGFLIRLTSQKGVDQKFGKLFFKRLYFSTHNQFLVFNRPARADPPPPPRLPMTEDNQIPSAEQIAQKTPLIYAVNPFPVKDGQIEWLASNSNEGPALLKSHDDDAFDEDQRRLGLLRRCDGLINLCNVTKVRHVRRGASPADDNIDPGSDVDFDVGVPNTDRDDGDTKTMDDERVFELVLRNDLVIRLQAFDKTTKKEWMVRLDELIRYWKLRTSADIGLYKQVRTQNLKRLKIDEEAEAYVGQFAQKWEVRGSYASPELYNMCGIGCCRSVHIAGHLYHKPRMHGSFSRILCVLSHGKLLMFADALRGREGSVLKHIHHERIGTLDLQECYIYSGMATAEDLLYKEGNTQVDRSKPGRSALPRIWLEDGWTSSDEDTSTTFVIWHGKKSGWFRSQDDANDSDRSSLRRIEGAETAELARGSRREKSRQRLRRVKKLGTEGKSIVFRARSRAERDHWVLSINMEIEKLQQGDEIRLVDDQNM